VSKTLRELAEAIVAGDAACVRRLIASDPALATARFVEGATRASATPYFIDAIRHYVYAGDTALHVAAAAYRASIVRFLVDRGAGVRAQNRRGQEPLHYAVDGGPNAPHWAPPAQAATVQALIAAGADPNAPDRGGTRPLHRAVRNVCSAAVRALLDGGADPSRDNGRGSTPRSLATQRTGRGGSGSAEAQRERAAIVAMLAETGD
jgi:hypothetical protein